MFINRSSKVSFRYLDWKVYMFMAGSGLILAGIYFNNRWVMWGALVLLVAAFSLRFLPGSDQVAEDAAEQESDESSGDA